MAITKGILLPRSPARYRFVLTPLADAMFQLLIFFMLSSNLAPYSLLTIRNGTTGDTTGTDAGADPVEEIAAPLGQVAIWNVDAGNVIVGGQKFGFEVLSDLAAALNANNDASIILVVRTEANVQDLSSVLESLAAAGVSNIQIAGGPS
jgi:biopolymer transport protein ExbD